jgi:hypothetical protein
MKVIHLLEGLVHYLGLREQGVVHLVIFNGSVDPGLNKVGLHQDGESLFIRHVS